MNYFRCVDIYICKIKRKCKRSNKFTHFNCNPDGATFTQLVNQPKCDQLTIYVPEKKNSVCAEHAYLD